MGVVIAVEGPDLSGKSTFLRTLREVPAVTRWPVFRMDVPPALLNELDSAEIENISHAFNLGLVTMKKTLSFLLDRCYVSSWVYSNVFGRRANLGYIDRVAYELNPLVVFMNTPIDVLVQRLEKRGDPAAFNRTRLIALYDGYQKWLSRNPFHDSIVVVNHEDPPYDAARLVVERALQRLDRHPLTAPSSVPPALHVPFGGKIL